MNSKRPTSESWNSEMRCLPNAPSQSTAPQQARSRHGQVVPGNTSAEVEVEVEVEEGDGECNFQMCHFSVQFTVHRLEPLIPFRGVRFTLLLAFSWISRKLHHELRRKSGSAGSRGGHATPAPPSTNFRFPTRRWIFVSLTGSPPIKCPVLRSGVTTFMGISKVLLFHQVIYHKSIHPLCQI
jgi:hypothetical protein